MSISPGWRGGPGWRDPRCCGPGWGYGLGAAVVGGAIIGGALAASPPVVYGRQLSTQGRSSGRTLASSNGIHVAQLYRHFDATGRLLYVGISLFAFRRLAAHERNAGWWKDVRIVTITPPYRTRAEAAAAEIEAIKNEKPLYNQQHHPAPVEPPIAPAMAGALMRRLAAARRHGILTSAPASEMPWPHWRNGGAIAPEEPQNSTDPTEPAPDHKAISGLPVRLARQS
jgi:hypothetical protein